MRSTIPILAITLLATACTKREEPESSGGEAEARREALHVVPRPEHLGDQPSFELNGPPLAVHAPGMQQASAIASDGEDYLVVWESQGPGRTGVFGARMKASGEVLDVPAIEIARSNGATAPDVTWDGSHYVVVWYSAKAIRAARVSRDGEVLDAGGVLVLPGGAEANIARFGDGTLLVWSDGQQAWAARLGADLVSRDPDGILLGDVRWGPAPSVAVVGDTALIAWAENNDPETDTEDAASVFALRLQTDGALLDPTPILLAEVDKRVRASSVGASDAGFLVAWELSHSFAHIRFAAIGAVLVSHEGELRAVPNPPATYESEFQSNPSVIDVDGTWLLVWEAWRDVLDGLDHRVVAARLGSGGWIEEPPLEISDQYGSFDPAVGAAGEGLIVAWHAGALGSYQDVFAARLDGDLVALDPLPIPLSTAVNQQKGIGLAGGDNGYLAAWADWRGEGWSVFGTRLSPDGVVRDPTGFPISSSLRMTAAPKTAVAFGDGRFLVTWMHQALGWPGMEMDIRARLVGSDTSLSEEIVVAPLRFPATPAVASDGARFLLAWADNHARYLDLSLVLPDGTSSLRSMPRDDFISGPALGFDGRHFVLAWFEGNVLYGSRVDAATGAPIDYPPVAILEEDGDDREIALACANGTCLVAWERYKSGPDGDVYFTIFDEDLVAPGTAGVAIAVKEGVHESDPAVSWDGTAFRLVWTDASAGLRSARVSSEGILLGGLQSVADLRVTEEAPSVASFGDGRSIIAWSDEEPSFGEGSRRGHLRMLASEERLRAHSAGWGVWEDSSVPFTLHAHDPEGRQLDYQVLAQPANGRVSGTPPQLVYRPNPDFHGRDGFDFVVHAGGESSPPARAEFLVLPVNDAPMAIDATYHVGWEPLAFTLGAEDVDGIYDDESGEGDRLTFEIVEVPAAGKLSGYPPELRYASDGEAGEYTLRFTVSDGKATSEPGTIRLVVSENLPPTASIEASSAEGIVGERASFVAVASDPEGAHLSLQWEIEGIGSEGWSRPHVFEREGVHPVTLRVSDGIHTTTAQLDYVVHPRGELEIPSRIDEGQPLVVSAKNATDVRWDFGDGSAAQHGLQAEHRYEDDGRYIVEVAITRDNGLTSNYRRLVEVLNLPPVIEPVPKVKKRAGKTVKVQLSAEDPAAEADPITWRLIDGRGQLSEDGVYTWKHTTVGTHEVHVAAADDDGGEAELLFEVKIERKPRGGCASGGGGLSLLSLLGLAFLFSRRRG